MPVAKAASHGLTFCSADTLEDYMGHTGDVGKRQYTCTLVKHTWQLEAPFYFDQLNKKCHQDTCTRYTSQHCTFVISALSKQYVTFFNRYEECIWIYCNVMLLSDLKGLLKILSKDINPLLSYIYLYFS